MRHIGVRLAVLWLAGLIGCSLVLATEPATDEQFSEALDHAFERLQANDLKEGQRLLTGAMDSPHFSLLPAGGQQHLLYLAGIVALELGEMTKAHQWLVRSTAMPMAPSEAWHARLRAAWVLEDHADAVNVLTEIARAWPDTLPEINSQVITRLAHEAHEKAARAIRLTLLENLFTAQWKPSELHEPSTMWRDLALLLLEDGQRHRAGVAALRVQDPHVLVGMRVDRRFEALRRGNPRHYDVERAASREVDRLRRAVDASPRSLSSVVQLGYALRATLQFDAMLALMDAAVERVRSAKESEPPYDDIEEQFTWILDQRARALMGLGRWDDALDQFVQAASMAENGDPNVSQIINLGFLYVMLGRPEDAVDAIAPVGDMSPYGRMQLESVRALAATQLGETDEAQRALAYMREHQSAARQTFQWTLVAIGALEEAAALLISQLQHPDQRLDALVEIQSYTHPQPASRFEEQWRERWRTLLGRADVRTAIAPVGKIERFAINGPIS